MIETPPSRPNDPDGDVQVRRIAGQAPGVKAHLVEVRQSFGVAYYLVTRDIKIRYRQTVLGFLWVVLQPIVMAAVLTIFLGRLAKVPTDGESYGIFSLAGLACWTYLASAVDAGTNSFVQDINLITKVYIPRLLIPLSPACSYALDLVVAALVAAVCAVVARGEVPLTLILLPVPAAWAILLAASVGVLFGSLNVKYRDIRVAVRFGTQVWFFLTPVAYSWTIVPEEWRAVYGLNPAAGIVSLFRWTILGGDAPPASMLLVSAFATVGLLSLALRQFNRLERSFADAI